MYPRAEYGDPRFALGTVEQNIKNLLQKIGKNLASHAEKNLHLAYINCHMEGGDFVLLNAWGHHRPEAETLFMEKE